MPYQAGFTTDGFLWLFDRDTGKYRREQPVNPPVIDHYYSFESDVGKKDPIIERFLANVIESEALSRWWFFERQLRRGR